MGVVKAPVCNNIIRLRTRRGMPTKGIRLLEVAKDVNYSRGVVSPGSSAGCLSPGPRPVRALRREPTASSRWRAGVAEDGLRGAARPGRSRAVRSPVVRWRGG